MKDFPKVSDLDIAGRKVLIRLDLDVPGQDDSRLEASKETILYLLEKGARLILIGHRGEPHGVVSQGQSLSSISERLGKIIGKKVNFVYDIVGAEAQKEAGKLGGGDIMMLENLRFDSREEQNDELFAKNLAALGEFYVNEAFADSHREHTSIVGIPKLLPHAAGFRFIKEVENLNKVLENPKKPVVVIISGVKEDKVEMAKDLAGKFDTVLVGGKLPVYFRDTKYKIQNTKLVIGDLIADGQDITLNTVERFKKEIRVAGTIVLAGVLGVYEEEGHRQGTREIFETVANASAFKVAGGGDTETAISMLGLRDKFDWVSVGGGAMLEFLANKTLPGIEALLH